MKVAYKLFRVRKDGSLGSLFHNCRAKLVPGETYVAEDCTKKGFKSRPGWHCCETPRADHLTTKGRKWYKVVIRDYKEHQRPSHQGHTWLVANEMIIVEEAVWPRSI